MFRDVQSIPKMQIGGGVVVNGIFNINRIAFWFYFSMVCFSSLCVFSMSLLFSSHHFRFLVSSLRSVGIVHYLLFVLVLLLISFSGFITRCLTNSQ